MRKGKELVGAEQILAGTSVSSDRTLTSGSGSPDTVAVETMHAVGWDFAVSIRGVRNRLCQGARAGVGTRQTGSKYSEEHHEIPRNNWR